MKANAYDDHHTRAIKELNRVGRCQFRQCRREIHQTFGELMVRFQPVPAPSPLPLPSPSLSPLGRHHGGLGFFCAWMPEGVKSKHRGIRGAPTCTSEQGVIKCCRVRITRGRGALVKHEYEPSAYPSPEALIGRPRDRPLARVGSDWLRSRGCPSTLCSRLSPGYDCSSDEESGTCPACKRRNLREGRWGVENAVVNSRPRPSLKTNLTR